MSFKKLRKGYIHRILDPQMLQKAHDIGGLVHSIVKHDDDCPMVNGGRTCNCVPDIETITHEEYMRRYHA